MKLLSVTWMAVLLILAGRGIAVPMVTNLESNMPDGDACIGEYVTFICMTTSFSLRWTVRAQSSTVIEQQFFHSGQQPGITINATDRNSGLELRFKLVSFIANPVNLTSTLVARASAVLDHGTIECRATSTEMLPFRILSDSPGIPTNIEINDKMYGTDSSNVTLNWMPPVDARRLAHYRIELTSSSKQLVVNMTEINLKDIPYNQETTVSISAVNDCSGEGMKLNFSFVIYGCNDPIPPDNAVLHNTSESMSIAVIAPGEVITFVCRFASGVYVHILCQESGLWYPDPSTVLCPSNCQIPTLNSFVEVELTNSTVSLQGSKLTLRCKEGFTPTKPHLAMETTACSSNGTWIPDPDNYHCQSDKGSCGSISCLGLYAAIGVSAGVFILLCGLCCGIVLASWRSWKTHARQSTYYEDTCGSMMGPVYDTIDPTYEKVHHAYQMSNKELEADSAEMIDNAAYLMISHKFDGQDCVV